MKKRALAILLAAVMMMAAVPAAFASAAPTVSISEQYTFKGSVDKWWCEESYWSSPVVDDLDGDGKLEVVNAAYTLNVMDAATGDLKWRVNSGKDVSSEYVGVGGNTADRVFTTPEVTDIDGDGKKEIVVAYGNGSISVLDASGHFKSGWPQQVTNKSLRSLAVGDLDGDGKKEIVVGAGIADSKSVWVYHADGTLAKGWPQLSWEQDAKNPKFEMKDITGCAYSYGIFGDGVTLGDLDGDGLPEVICAIDNPYVNAYHADGSVVKASSSVYGSRAWGLIALYEDYDEEIKGDNKGWGWKIDGKETRAQLYRAELGHSVPVYTDVDGDGKAEVVVTALMVDRTNFTKTSTNRLEDTRYMTAFILNQDRTRYENKALGFDWTTPPTEQGGNTVRGPLKQHDPESLAANVMSVPVVSDLDGDGYKEILFNAYDGKLHCFSLGSTTKEYGSWPYTMPKSTGSVYEYATPPACVDLDGDGTQEVIFASWTDNANSSQTHVDGALYVLSADGKLLAKQNLHAPYHDSLDNGVMAAPTVADVDKDGKYEVLLNTTTYALCAYELTAKSAASFADVPADSWFGKNVAWAVNRNITNGTGYTPAGVPVFDPYRTCTQSEIITFLYRAMREPAVSGSNPFGSKVDPTQFYYKPLLWAYQQGVITDKNIDPMSYCTRADVVTYLWRLAGKPTGDKANFTDVPASAPYAQAVAWAASNGITTGTTTTTFSPDNTCTRSEIVTFLRRYVELK